MEVARGGTFGSASKQTSEKKNDPQSRISQLTGMAKSLYRNDFARLESGASIDNIRIYGVRSVYSKAVRRDSLIKNYE